MAIFLNYYPCSYGDSLVNMFLGKSTVRQNNLIYVDRPQFKLLTFYNLDQAQQQIILRNLDNTIYSCHRQNQFDFGHDHQVISILLDKIDFLPKRFEQIHMHQMGKDISNPLLHQLKSKTTLDKIIKADYQTWSKKNILSTDKILPISMLWDQVKLKQFCDKFNFEFSSSQVNEIIDDMNRYVL